MKAAIQLASVSLAVMAFASVAGAQTPAPSAVGAPQTETTGQAPAGNADIVVTGSRITTSGFNAPTPTTVIGEEQIAKNAQPNIFTTIAQLPSLQGSTGAATGTFSTSSGLQGLSSFSLRGLQPIRTLTLLDGQRVVGANVTGVPDISMFPQLLVKRVDVVTGGASASYGSDAVGGVVNFITDTRFEGFKGNILGSITKYGDDETGLVQAAWGKSFLDNRLHVVLSGEYDHEEGVGPGDFGTDLAGSRDWYRATTLMNTGQTNNGLPQFNYRDYAQPYQYARYGLINNGPLQGIAFDQNGTPYNFNYGSGGQPLGNGQVSNCFRGNSFCVGGDLSGAPGSGASLKSALERINGYTRIGYDFADDNEAYVSVNVAQVKTSNQPSPGYNRPSLTVQCANPFLPQLIRDRCATAGITQFSFGTSNGAFPDPRVHTDRRQYRFVGGLKGKFAMAGTDWNYDAYYEHGITISDIRVQDIVLQNRYVAATNAITLNGAIVCADPAARAAGCQPINVFGGFAPSSAALAYVAPHENGPFQHTKLTQDVASLNFSGNPFDLWAGPVSVAFGGEYRREYYRVNADPYGAGVSAISPNSEDYPADPLLNSAQGSNWAAGNYKNGHGKYDVWEGYLEVDLPLINSDSMGRANLNGAARVTHYSTSGTVWTWKVGGTWDTPLDGIRLRAVTSRDVRAPNLSELFAAPTVTTLPNFNDPFRNQAVQVFQNTIGNTNLKPEVARNTELGIVLSRPSWLPGLSLSFDYYNIKLNGVVSTLSADQIVRFCFEGNQAFCGGFQLDGAQGTNFVNVQPFNLASWKTSGFDIEASYQWQQPLGLPGSFTVRALGTHIRKFIVNAGIAGVDPVDQAGANNGNTPDWKWLAVQTYDSGRFSLTVQERWISDGTFGNQYVVCQSSCPTSTTNHPTIDYNKMKGAFYVDIGATFKIGDSLTIYGKVDNLFDKDPVPAPQTNTGLDINPALYDTLGRIYRAGIRFNF
ncbi:TonB-dependent receptor plug domain-containing protein [Sphingobium chungbukense]|uniref:TonB-dependent receptor n=1 Tax=Sphingobium chungbukense TaxID=56193 RepID=A0A0M3ALB7_9SPHN|nr:TonB-dependent receptor [Sphingobium chungbukense]KKW90738.1 TonB-dependent receptor [Sphingobium chungbukense]